MMGSIMRECVCVLHQVSKSSSVRYGMILLHNVSINRPQPNTWKPAKWSKPVLRHAAVRALQISLFWLWVRSLCDSVSVAVLSWDEPPELLLAQLIVNDSAWIRFSRKKKAHKTKDEEEKMGSVFLSVCVYFCLLKVYLVGRVFVRSDGDLSKSVNFLDFHWLQTVSEHLHTQFQLLMAHTSPIYVQTKAYSAELAGGPEESGAVGGGASRIILSQQQYKLNRIPELVLPLLWSLNTESIPLSSSCWHELV